MKTLKKIIVIAAAAIFAVMYGCGKIEHRGSMVVKMTDAPALYQEVNIEIKSVEAHYSDINRNDGWIELKTKSGVYNLLELRGGVTAVIADDERMPLGTVTQMRLVLGANNSVKANGISYSLIIPSGTETGIKLNVDKTIKAGQKYEILMDFDAEKSIIVTGNGMYQLSPVISVVK